MDKYLVTGYSKNDKRMATHTYAAIEHVAELINQLAKEEIIKNPKDLDFDVLSRKSHHNAVILDTNDYTWSIYLLK